MKTRIIWIGRMTGMVLGAGILVSCGMDPANVLKAEKADGSESVLRADALSQTNHADLDMEPVLKAEPAPLKTSPGVDEVVKMAESGVGDAVIQAYVENSPVAYDLSAAEILYLTDLGISEPILSAMIRHGNLLRGQESKVAAQDTKMEDTVAAVKKSLAEEQNAEPQDSQPTPGVAPPATENLPPVPEYATPPPTYSPAPEPVYADAPEDVNYFYGSLSPYGSWFDLPGHGWCWRPTAVLVDPGWRPYSHRGHWLYSNCGWYWHSDYSWGWAPFHYGRWYNHPASGWVWFPDSVWAPAWVTWRYTDSHCGWAPLPPGTHCGPGGLSYHKVGVGVGFDFGLSSLSFSFVARSHFADKNPHRYIVPPGQAQSIYTQSKVINNIVVDKNNTIINNGVGYERIATASRQEIRKVVVRDPPTIGGKAVKPDRVEKDGTSLVVYRPQLQAQTPARNALVATRAQQELRKDFGAAPQPNVQIGNQGQAVPHGSVPFPSWKPVAVTSISSRDEHTLVTTRTELPAAANLGGVQTTPPIPGKSPQTVTGPQIVKPINERGTRSQGTRSAFATPIDSRSQPVDTVPVQPQYPAPSQSAPQPVRQPQQQPYIVGQPNRQEIQRQAPAVRNYALPQFVQQPAYRSQSVTPTYAAPQPVVTSPAQRYYSPPPTTQPAYRPAPAYTPPARPAPVQAPRAQAQAAPARRESDKK